MQFRVWWENNVYFHGAKGPIEKFSYAFIGQGHDQEGPGFYFTSDENDARRYIDAKTGGRLYRAQLKMDKMVPTRGPINKREIAQLIKWAPELEDALQDWDENPQIALQNAIKAMTDRLNPHDAFQQVWYDFYHRRGQDAAYLENMTRLGYDGVIVEKSGGITHVIMFSPQNITILPDEPQG